MKKCESFMIRLSPDSDWTRAGSVQRAVTPFAPGRAIGMPSMITRSEWSARSG